MTGCGCLLVVGVLALLLYVFTFGSTDAGEPIEQAAALAALGYSLARARPGPKATGEDERREEGRSFYVMAMAGRRSLQMVARS